MSDFREAAADRFERAADRMSNSGFLDEERSFRDAAAQIRAGLSPEEIQALEQRMLTGQKPRLGNRLTALAAMGEYDGGGGDAQGSAASATGDAVNDGPVITDMESGASQLLSTAASTGLSDPFSSAQTGWISNSQDINPYTGVTAGGDNLNAFTGGLGIDPYTGMASDGDNSNAFTGGQDVNPLTGEQNTESFTGGGALSQSPPATGWAAFGYNGPPPSILASQDLLADNSVPNSANVNLASDATGSAPVGVGSLTINGGQWAWTNIISLGDGVYNQFISPDGTTIALQLSGGGPVVLVDAGDGSVIGAYSPSGKFVPAPVDIGRAQPGELPPADFAPDPDEQTAGNTQSAAGSGAGLNPQLTPAQEAQLNAAIQQAVGPPDPNPVNAGPPGNINDVLAGTDWAPPAPGQNQPPASPPPNLVSAPADASQNQPPASQSPGSGTVPFDPMADSPFASWLLYGHDTPILDALTNDSNLKAAQNVALGVALTAGTIATGGLLLEAAPAAIAATNAAIASAAATVNAAVAGFTPSLVAAGAGGGGFLMAHPEIGEELEELGPQMENTIMKVGEAAESSIPEWRTEQVEELLEAARDAGLRVSANGPDSWTARQLDGAIAYREAFTEAWDGENLSEAASKGGDAFHEVMEAAERGIDTRYFNANVELKTVFGTPSIETIQEAVQQSESYEPGQLNVVHFFDMLNGVKYFVQW